MNFPYWFLHTSKQPHLPKYVPSIFRYIISPSISGFWGKGSLSKCLWNILIIVLYDLFTFLKEIKSVIEILTKIQLLKREKYLSDRWLRVNVFKQFKHLYLGELEFDLPQLWVFLELHFGQVYLFFYTHFSLNVIDNIYIVSGKVVNTIKTLQKTHTFCPHYRFLFVKWLRC